MPIYIVPKSFITVSVCLTFFLSWIPVSTACKSWEFRCLNGDCIKHTLRCDGEVHCRDFSDELNCPRPPVTSRNNKQCNLDQFQCANGECIYRGWNCDGQTDCTDGSDEWDCATPQSPADRGMSLGSIVGLSIAVVGLVVIIAGIAIMLTCLRKKNVQHSRQMRERRASNRLYYQHGMPYNVSGLVLDREPPPRYDMSQADILPVMYSEHLVGSPPPYSSHQDITRTNYSPQFADAPPRYSSTLDLRDSSATTDDTYCNRSQQASQLYSNITELPVSQIYQNLETIRENARQRASGSANSVRDRSASKDSQYDSKENVCPFNSKSMERNKRGKVNKPDKQTEGNSVRLQREQHCAFGRDEIGNVQRNPASEVKPYHITTRRDRLLALGPRSSSTPNLPTSLEVFNEDPPLVGFQDNLKMNCHINIEGKRRINHDETGNLPSTASTSNRGESINNVDREGENEVRSQPHNAQVQIHHTPVNNPPSDHSQSALQNGASNFISSSAGLGPGITPKDHIQLTTSRVPTSIQEMDIEAEGISKSFSPRKPSYSNAMNTSRPSLKAGNTAFHKPNNLDRHMSQSMSVLLPGGSKLQRKGSITSISSWDC